jgi:hypothetical protein
MSCHYVIQNAFLLFPFVVLGIFWIGSCIARHFDRSYFQGPRCYADSTLSYCEWETTVSSNEMQRCRSALAVSTGQHCKVELVLGG